MTIMERIQSIMQLKHISRAELVRLSGLKKTTVYRLFDENIDGSKIRIETLAPIAKALKVPIEYLIGEKDFETNKKTVENKEEIVRIVMYSDGKIELFVNGEKRHVKSINFNADTETVPTLTTTEFPTCRNKK